MEKKLNAKHIDVLHRLSLTGTNFVGGFQILFLHLLLNLPQVLASSVPSTGGRR